MYYPSSENKGADQLLGYREAGLRLCFRIYRLLVFLRGGSLIEPRHQFQDKILYGVVMFVIFLVNEPMYC